MNGWRKHFITKEPKFYHRLDSKMYNGKAILVPVKLQKFYTGIKYDKNEPENEY